MGLLLSGFIVSKFKPSARLISGYNVVLGLVYFSTLLIFSMLGCPTAHMYGTVAEDGVLKVTDSFFQRPKFWKSPSFCA